MACAASAVLGLSPSSQRRIWFVLNREDLKDWTSEERTRFERFLRDQCERVRTFPVAWTPRELDVEVYLRP